MRLRVCTRDREACHPSRCLPRLSSHRVSRRRSQIGLRTPTMALMRPTALLLLRRSMDLPLPAQALSHPTVDRRARRQRCALFWAPRPRRQTRASTRRATQLTAKHPAASLAARLLQLLLSRPPRPLHETGTTGRLLPPQNAFASGRTRPAPQSLPPTMRSASASRRRLPVVRRRPREWPPKCLKYTALLRSKPTLVDRKSSVTSTTATTLLKLLTIRLLCPPFLLPRLHTPPTSPKSRRSARSSMSPPPARWRSTRTTMIAETTKRRGPTRMPVRLAPSATARAARALSMGSNNRMQQAHRWRQKRCR